MIRLLIISDDFTGALDTSVHFAQNGAKTKVVFDKDYIFAQDDETEVIVIDAETRHVSWEEAYQIVFKIIKRGKTAGIEFFYLKTDSALRGNIGSSIQALSDAYGAQVVPFIPAYPKMNRLTIKGIQYIDNIKVGDSVFGKDPFNPVRYSSVKEIISQQSQIACVEIHSGDPPGMLNVDCPTVAIYDSVTDQDIFDLAEDLNRYGGLNVMAGCAGFASVLPGIFHLENALYGQMQLNPGLFVASGSVNPITLNQISYAVEHGFKYISVLNIIKKVLKEGDLSFYRSGEFKMIGDLCKSSQYLIIDSSDYNNYDSADSLVMETGIPLEELRERIPKIFGMILKELFVWSHGVTLMITGGDTLIGFLETLGTCYMEPVEEIMPGIVISTFPYQQKQCNIITKSGGFGEKDLFIRMISYMKEKERYVGTV